MEINYKELLENLLHELGQINSLMKTSAEAMSKSLKGIIDRDNLIHHSDVILENSFLFSTHIDGVVYQLNPHFFTIENTEKRNIYGKFYKAVLSYRRAAKQKEIKINVDGKIGSFIDTYPVIDTLPILILDNALKYSVRNSNIDIEFYESEDEIQVSVCNVGPFVEVNERALIFDRGFRGIEARKSKVSGLGFGLSFLKYICDIHDASIQVFCKDNYFKVGDIKYSEFKIQIAFPKNIRD
jgi:signal transduction histidine kinase